MAILVRRGLESEFRPEKMFPGELGLSLDTGKAWYCWGANKVKLFATEEDLREILNASGDEYQKFQELIKYLQQNPNVYDQIIADITDLQKSKQDKMIGTSTSSHHTLSTSPGGAVIKEIPGITKQVKTTGAQLFDASKLQTKSAGGATITNNWDGSFKVSGSGKMTEPLHVYYDYSHDETVRILKGGILKLKVLGGNVYPHPGIMLYNSGGTVFDLGSDGGQADIAQSAIDDSKSYIRIYFYGGTGTVVPGTIKPMVYQDGDGTWEPYTGGKPGPNPNYPQQVLGVGSNGWTPGGFSFATGNYYSSYSGYYCIKSRKPCAAGDTITVKEKGSINFAAVNFYFYDKNGKYIGSVKGSENVRSCIVGSAAESKGACSFKVEVRNDAGWPDAKIMNGIEVKVGSKTNQIALVGSNNGKESMAGITLDYPLYSGDRIYLEDGDLWLRRENGVAVFDGSADEEWAVYNNAGSNYALGCQTQIRPQNEEQQHCTQLIRTQSYRDTTDAKILNTFVYGAQTGIMYACVDKNVGAFRDWLTSHPLTVVYKLVTPTITKLGQPEAFGLRTFPDQTHIWIDDDLEPEFAVDYPINQAGGYATDAFCRSKANQYQAEMDRQALANRIAKIEVDLDAHTFIVE